MQKVELYRRFFPETSLAVAHNFVRDCGEAETMAEFQGLLLTLMQAPENTSLRKRALETAVSDQLESIVA